MFQIGLQITNCIEQLHKLGFLHLDIKGENILLDSNEYSAIESSRLHLIDFGLAQSYLNDDGSHVPLKKV